MITPHVHLMKETLAKELRSSLSSIAIKATTNEQIGDLGRREGIAAFAVCLLVAKTS
jgi:2-C-methyl-D-erythritol 2,4-cyclodiphosphate synthase